VILSNWNGKAFGKKKWWMMPNIMPKPFE
jgi:hypothetical protein